MRLKEINTMKFITLRDWNEEKRTYTLNIYDIGYIETFKNASGKVFTWVYVKGGEGEPLCVKETEEYILKVLEQVETLKQFQKYLR